MMPLRPAGLAPALAALLGLAACELPPPTRPTADARQQADVASRIEGRVVVQGAVRGNAVLFLYARERPPPTGRPVAFTVVPGERLFGGALHVAVPGVYTAPFSFSLVRPGSYLIRGFLDADSCLTGASPCRASDFNPWYGVTAEPNRGDVGGGAVDLATRALVEIAVTAERPATDVSVLFQEGPGTVVPFDRPAFQVAAAFAHDGQRATPLGGPPPLTSVTHPAPATLLLELAPQSFQDGTVHQAPGAFAVGYVDDNGDKVPDDRDGDGRPDLWPRIVVRKLADTATLLHDENDLDRNGVLDDEGALADHDGDGRPDLVVLAAGFPEDEYVRLKGKLAAEATASRPYALASSLRVAVRPRALEASGAAPRPLPSLPRGRYALILQYATGQSWRVPNELSPALAAELGLPGHASQAFVIEVP